jgi:hypothetical protein
MGTSFYTKGTCPEGVMRTKKVKRNIRSNAYGDDSWRLDYDLREVPKPVRNNLTKT